MSNLIIEPVEFYFVWTKTGHVRHRCHTTQASAEAEADRLASLMPYGKKYIVLRAIRKCHVPVAPDPVPPSIAEPACVHSEGTLV